MQLTLNSMGFDCAGPLTRGCSATNAVDVFSLSYDFLHDIFFPLADFIVRIQCAIHVTCKIRIHRLFMLSVRLLVKVGC